MAYPNEKGGEFYSGNPFVAGDDDPIEAVLKERLRELMYEGKRWYDLLRFGRSQNFKYKDQFINMIIENNSTVSASWIRSVLKNTDAWYLPISQGEIDSNPNLIQNPYYDVTAN